MTRYNKALAILVICSLLAVAAVMSVPAVPTAQADEFAQIAQNMAGKHIYFSEGSGEPSRFTRNETGLSHLGGLLELYGAETYTLDWRSGIPPNADLVIIAGPTRQLGADRIAWLWEYLLNGGRLLLFAEPVRNASSPLNAEDGLFVLTWNDMGLRARNDVAVQEGALRPVIPPTPHVPKDEPTPTLSPAVDVPELSTDFMTTRFNPGHPIIGRLEEGLFFTTARSIEMDGAPRDAQATALILAPPEIYGESDYEEYLKNDYVDFDEKNDAPPGDLVLAVAMENIITKTRMVVVGDRDFVTNGGGFTTSPSYSGGFVFPGNVRFTISAITWLLETESVQDQLSFPTPAPTTTPTNTPTPAP